MSDSATLEKALGAALASVVNKRLAAIQQELVAELTTSLGGAVAQAPSSGVLNSAYYRIASARSQTEMLLNLLDATAAFARRSALLVIKGERLAGWRSRGFEDGAGDRLRDLSLPAEGDNGWRNALAEQAATTGVVEAAPAALTRTFFDAAGTPADGRCYLIPVLVRERPVAAIYADTGSTANSLDLPALDLLARVAGLCLEISAVRQRTAAPSPSAAASQPAPEVSEEQQAPAAPLSATGAVDAALQAASAAAIAAPPEPAPAPAAAAVVGPDYDNLPPQEHDIHKKAFRFAKLLVDDLILYNKDKLETGRAQRDIYNAIKDDIDKSRSAYDKKFGDTPAGKVDYFHSELVRRVAQENASALGAEYPGPLI